MANKLKNSMRDYLKRLARVNEQSFGSGRLDCCNMNKKQSGQKRKCGAAQ